MQSEVYLSVVSFNQLRTPGSAHSRALEVLNRRTRGLREPAHKLSALLPKLTLSFCETVIHVFVPVRVTRCHSLPWLPFAVDRRQRHPVEAGKEGVRRLYSPPLSSQLH